MIKYVSHFSGVGAFEQAMSRMKFKSENIQACDPDYFARLTFIHNYGTKEDWELANTPEHKYFATEITKMVYDKSKLSESEQLRIRKEANEFAKKFSFYYPFNVYDVDVRVESVDVFCTSPPCQSFSLAGKRLGKDDDRGILFFNSHAFIKNNNPRFFIIENVKGLLSDDSGKTFEEWIKMLGGKSVNGSMTFFPHEDSVPYHIYWKVLNAKHHGVPQNRERVFIVGIRDDQDNNFRWPKEEPLTKRLKDVLEDDVPEKYFLSEKMVSGLLKHNDNSKKKGRGFNFKPALGNDIGKCIRANNFKMGPDDNYIKIKSATLKGYEVATENDSINFSVPNSETRRGRVGKGVAQTLDTQCNQGVIQLNPSKESGGKQPYQQNRVYDTNGLAPATNAGQSTWGGVCVPVLTPDRPEKRQNGRRFKDDGEEMFTITTQDRHGVFDGYSIRRLTPRECFRLMDFPEEFDFSVVSDSQAYKQAGNSIVVRVLEKILSNLNL
jgi:DNA (cytosine-5)-methyltransferase 1